MAAPSNGTALVGGAIGTAPVPVPTGGGTTPVGVAPAGTGGGVPAMRPTLESEVENAYWFKVKEVLMVVTQLSADAGEPGACT